MSSSLKSHVAITIILVLAFVASPHCCQMAWGQDQPSTKKADPSADAKLGDTGTKSRPMLEQLRKHYAIKANLLKPTLADSDSTPLKISPALLTWTSSDLFGEWSGDIFVWTAKGRIQLVGCLGSRTLEDQKWDFFQELHSLADEPIKDIPLDDSHEWHVPKETLPLLRVEGAPVPAETDGQRLIQMRQLAATFSAGMKVNDMDQELRLLTKPIFRLSGGTVVRDCALFGFVSTYGTDPEAMLLIEARQFANAVEWTCSPIRFTTRDVWMRRHNKEVWRVGKHTLYGQKVIEEVYFWRGTGVVTLAEIQSKPTD